MVGCILERLRPRRKMVFGGVGEVESAMAAVAAIDCFEGPVMTTEKMLGTIWIDEV